MILKELQEHSSDRADDSGDELGVSDLPPDRDEIQQASLEETMSSVSSDKQKVTCVNVAEKEVNNLQADSISSKSCDDLNSMFENETENDVSNVLKDSNFSVSGDEIQIMPEKAAENQVNDVFIDTQISETDSDVIIDHMFFGELDCGREVMISQEQESDVSESNTDSVGDVNSVNNIRPEVCVSESVCDMNNCAAAEELPEKKPHRNPKQKYCIHDYKGKPDGVKYFTGLETYFKFEFVFQSLRTDLFPVTYRDRPVKALSLEDQFFMTLWKLRRNTPDYELGEHFGVSRTTVSNIFVSMVSFMADQWGKIDVWLTRSLTDYYMPDSFKKAYPTTRGIIDGTECYIAKPSNPRLQQATWSTYKNANTVKVLVTGNPCGLISDTTPAYGGATSDRQIVERSTLIDKCQKGDSLMADRGFNVQDMFAPKGVTINIPAFLKGKDHLSGATLMKDRKLASERVHIERLIGLTKTYKMLSQELDARYVPLASEIFFVCAMLCNFRENIVSKKK